MSKLSYRGLIDAKIIKRTDNGMAVLPANIRIRDGFNLRDVNADDYETDIQALMDHIKRGGKYPALEVVLADDGFQGVDVVDGHRRLTAIRRLIEQGDPIEYIRIEPFVGNLVDQLQRIMTSNEGRRLSPLEIAEGYRRLAAYNLTPDDIARRVGKTRQHVDQMLILATAPHEVQQMVKAGEVSATEAIITTRQHGRLAVEKLQAARAKAGGKVTAKALREWTPKFDVVRPVLRGVEELIDCLDTQTRALLVTVEQHPGKEHMMVSVPASVLATIVNATGELEDARKAAEEKRRAKAAQASQGDLVDAQAGA